MLKGGDDVRSGLVGYWMRVEDGKQDAEKSRGVGDVYKRRVFFRAEDGIRDGVASRGLVDVYKKQVYGAVLLIRSACMAKVGWCQRSRAPIYLSSIYI